MTLRKHPVALRHHSAPDKEIGLPVAVEITDGHTGAVLEDVRKRIAHALKVSMAVVEIEARPEGILLPPELVAAAHDEEVLTPVSVGVEEAGTDVFR